MSRKSILLVFSVFVVVLIVVIMLVHTTNNPTAFASKEPKLEMDMDSIDHVEIDKSELKLCCEFIESGIRKGCWVLNRYDCSYCEASCH